MQLVIGYQLFLIDTLVPVTIHSKIYSEKCLIESIC